MIRPKYIRFVMPSGQNPTSSRSLQDGHPFISVGTSFHHQNFRQVLSETSSSAPITRIIINPKLNLSNAITSVDKNTTVIAAPVDEKCSKPSSNNMVNGFNTGEDIREADACSITVASDPQSSSLNTNMKKSCSPYHENIRRNPKKPKSKNKLEETSSTLTKRSKNWSEDETLIFITIWAEFYERLTSGGSRNAPIYNAMAQQLNNIFSNRILTSNDVKSKIGNLVSEYRKKKREQGRTGASPCTWAYYDAIDKLLGERPYNDDNLLSESMIIEEELLNDIENASIPDLNLTQYAQEVDDLIALTEETIHSIRDKRNTTSSSSDAVPVVKVNTPIKVGSAIKKPVSSKKTKKRTSEFKIDLLQQLLGKIENANEAASQSEVKILDLLEKQTRLQQESVQNEREFLNVFKTIMNNTNLH